MREIEFRAKKLNSFDWIYGYLCNDYLSGELFIQHKISDTEFPKWKATLIFEDTIGQYTGLKDKNGVKIFEGDIFMENVDFNERYLVYWNGLDCGFIGLKMKDNFNSLDLMQLIDNGYICGNIHDAKE